MLSKLNRITNNTNIDNNSNNNLVNKIKLFRNKCADLNEKVRI